nr:hypothetical protein [Borreliella bissettiae]
MENYQYFLNLFFILKIIFIYLYIMYKYIKEQQEKDIDHAYRLFILTITIFEINLILENYSQKTLLKK